MTQRGTVPASGSAETVLQKADKNMAATPTECGPEYGGGNAESPENASTAVMASLWPDSRERPALIHMRRSPLAGPAQRAPLACSSEVEQSAVNRPVLGSIPGVPAN